MRAAYPLVACALTVGCTATTGLNLPVVPGARSVAIIADPSGRAFFADLGEEALGFPVPDEATVVVAAYYLHSLAALGLPSGVAETAVAPSDALPAPLVLSERALDGDAWREVAASAVFGAFRLARGSQEECLHRGGCFVGPECVSPCPAIDPPAPAAITPFPAAPDFLGCPADWAPSMIRVDSTSGAILEFAICELPPSGQVCPAGEVRLLGGCRAIAACGAEDWPALPAGPSVRFVHPQGRGDGLSRASPIGSIAEARRSGGTIFLLSRAVYPESVSLGGGEELHGVCTESVIAPPPGQAAISVRGGSVRLDHLALEGGNHQLDLDEGAQVEASQLALSGSSSVAVSVRGGSALRLGRCHIEASGLAALHVVSSSVSLVDVAVVDGLGPAAILVDETSTLTAARIAIAYQGAERAQGIVSAGRLTLREALIDRPRWRGIYGRVGSKTALYDVVVRDIQAGVGEEIRGYGVLIYGAQLDAQRLRIDGAAGTGLALLFESQGTITDLVVRDSAAPVSRAENTSFHDGTVARLDRAFLQRAHGVSIYAVGEGTILRATDLVIVDGIETGSGADLAHARGIQIAADAAIELSRGYLGNNDWDGIGFLSAAQRRSTIADVVSESNGHAGIWVQGQRTVELSRVELNENLIHGLEVGETTYATVVNATDVQVRGGGKGIRLSSGSLDVRRFSVDGASPTGLDVAFAESARFHQGVVAHCASGLTLYKGGIELAPILDRVRFEANTVELSVLK